MNLSFWYPRDRLSLHFCVYFLISVFNHNILLIFFSAKSGRQPTRVANSHNKLFHILTHIGVSKESMLSITQQVYKAAYTLLEVNWSFFPGKEEVWSTVTYFTDCRFSHSILLFQQENFIQMRMICLTFNSQKLQLKPRRRRPSTMQET